MLAALLCSGLGACASVSSDAADASHRALAARAAKASTTTTTVKPGCSDDRDALKSLAPLSPLPSPGHMPDGSFMKATVQRRGRLIAGVDENTPHFSARDPITMKIDGLEVDIVRAIARAITGRSAIQLKTVVTNEKLSAVTNGTVDLTVSAVSMNCARLGSVDFSTEYYTAQHKLLVRSDSSIRNIDETRGRRVCITAGSSSVKVLRREAPDAIPVLRDARTDCLAALQQGQADAYLSHDSILIGMQEQDATTKILPQRLNPQHYGIAISKEHPEFVRFVNAVLQRMRDDGELAFLYAKWLGPRPPAVPEPQYLGAG
jgi:polar amino acid transport system substrate-binding protein